MGMAVSLPDRRPDSLPHVRFRADREPDSTGGGARKSFILKDHGSGHWACIAGWRV